MMLKKFDVKLQFLYCHYAFLIKLKENLKYRFQDTTPPNTVTWWENLLNFSRRSSKQEGTPSTFEFGVKGSFYELLQPWSFPPSNSFPFLRYSRVSAFSYLIKFPLSYYLRGGYTTKFLVPLICYINFVLQTFIEGDRCTW